jgi:prophage regulatory protein
MARTSIPNLPVRQILSLAEVTQVTGLRKTAIYVAMKRGEFPRNLRITGAKVGWLRSDIDAWIARLVAERDALERAP